MILFLISFNLQELIPSPFLRIIFSFLGFSAAYTILSYKLNIYRIFDEIFWSKFIKTIKYYMPLLDN